MVVGLLGSERRAAGEVEAQTAGVFVREAGRQVGGRPYLDPAQQVLHVRPHDPLGRELLGLHLPVEQRDRQQVGKRVVSFLLGVDLLLAAFLAAADDVVGDLEGLELDSLDAARVERVCLAQLEQRLERRLGVDLALEKRAPNALEVLSFPVDLEVAGDRTHETFVALEHFGQARDPTCGEEGRLDDAEGGEGISEPLPLRERPGAVTRIAFSAVPAIATALAVSASPRRNAFAAPAAAAYAPCVVWSNPFARTGASSESRHCTW
ncbi:MAG: hypothetical protein WKF65_17605 [Gaiellaceae bacterium]